MSSGWKEQLVIAKRKMRSERDRARTVKMEVPVNFSFKRHDLYDFRTVLNFFNWELENVPVRIDLRKCSSANYQALALLVLYIMRLKGRGCRVTVETGNDRTNAAKMWRQMGALGLFNVLRDETETFNGNAFKPLFAIRNSDDFKAALAKANEYCDGFNISYVDTLRHILSELLYNTIEHGVSHVTVDKMTRRLPSVTQFTWYETRREMHFIIADCGIGIKAHLEQTYPNFDSHEEAILKAIQPGISGTFGITDPYKEKNNQGVGLFISSNIIHRLRADMHILSGDGLLHVSATDVTTKQIDANWPGTIVLVTLRVEPSVAFELDSIMSELREKAQSEIDRKSNAEKAGEFYVSINNHFGPRAEDKQTAVRFRDRSLMPAIDQGKSIVFDFADVRAAPHSFLGALLATPIKTLGISAYKRLRFKNCSMGIRETIDIILQDNT